MRDKQFLNLNNLEKESKPRMAIKTNVNKSLETTRFYSAPFHKPISKLFNNLSND